MASAPRALLVFAMLLCAAFSARAAAAPPLERGAAIIDPAALRELEAWGLEDVFRRHHDDPRCFSWWDYRAGDFHEGRGMRIDLMLATAPLARATTWCVIDRNARKGKLPSDHAPVVVDLDWPS